MVFGLAMDYSVFMLAATREQWEKSGDPREALIEGMARSGCVIFSAAAVMVAVFFTFAITAWAYPPIAMGAILGFAVIIEATTIRLMLVPVAMRLAGRWAWWIPQPLARACPKSDGPTDRIPPTPTHPRGRGRRTHTKGATCTT